MKLCALLAGSLLLVCPLFAQESGDLVRVPDRGVEHFINGVIVLPATDRPFSARSAAERTRTLEDGTVLSTHLLTVVARDSEGRIYRERHKSVPLNSNEPSLGKLFASLIPSPTRKPSAMMPLISAMSRHITHRLHLHPCRQAR